MSKYGVYPSSLLNQTLNITTVEGESVTYTFKDLDKWKVQMVTVGLIQGIRIGFSILTTLMVIMHQRKRTVLFYMYLLALSCILVHSSFELCYAYGGFASYGPYLTGSYANITQLDVERTCAGNAFQVLIIVIVEVCLFLHSRILISSIDTALFRYLSMVGLALFVVVPTVFVWIFYSVVASRSVVEPFYEPPTWPGRVASPLFTASIVFFSLLSCSKLAVAIWRRRKLGLKQFDTYQVLFIVGIQTMFIPAIFTIIDFAASKTVPQGFSSLCSMMVVVFLPLSGMWARFRILTPGIATRFLAPVSSETASFSGSDNAFAEPASAIKSSFHIHTSDDIDHPPFGAYGLYEAHALTTERSRERINQTDISPNRKNIEKV